MTSTLSPLHEWRGGLKFFLPKQRSGMWKVGSGVLGKLRPNTKRPHQNLPKGQAKHETPTPKLTEKPGQTRNAHTKTYQKASPSQGSKPHHLMKCERGARQSRVPLSHFGGRGGTSSPHKKNRISGDLSPHTQKNYVEMELGEDGPESPLFPFSLRRSSVRLGISSWLYSSTLREYKLS